MHRRTDRHVATARENRDFATALVNDYNGTPPSLNWAAVAAFYAAVHYVNAYLWELAHLEPSSHFERASLIARWPLLQPLVPAYQRLQRYAINARYTPGFRMQRGDVMDLLETDLAIIAQAIESTLLQDET